MKMQPKSPAHCRKKVSPFVRRPQTSSWQPHPDSILRTPAVGAQDPFTIQEHSRGQREIEERARRFLLAKSCTSQDALHDWLKAETEGSTKFAQTLTQRRQMQPASGETQTKTEKTSTLPPVTRPEFPMTWNLKLTAALQRSL